jgi:CHAD domain-containing protein
VGALRRLFESLAEVRECDVFLEATLPEVALNTVAAVDRSAFEVAVRLHRASALGSLRRAFDGGDLAVLVSVLALRLEGRGWSARRQPLDEFTAALGAREFAVRRIRALHRRLIDATPRDRADVAGWHAARKRAKKLRYAAEPLRLTHPAKARKTQRYARRLGQLQEMLGDLNDLRTAGALMARLDATANAELGTPMRIIRDAVYAHVAARTQRLLPKVARALKRVRAAAPRLPRALRRPQAVAIVGTAPAPTAWVATQVAAAWASAGLRTGVCAAKVLPAVRAWLAQRSDKQPRIERLRRKELPAPKRLQRVAIAQPVPKRAKGWRRLRKEADVVVLVVAADAAAGTADVLTRARKAGVEPLIVATAVGAAPPIDAVTTLRWRKVEQSQMRRGAGPFAAGRANKVAAHSAWLPLLTALERRL